VLIGGLGLGYTLKAALAALPPDAELLQVEAFETVVDWHRQHLQALAVPLDDERVTVRVGDVTQLIARHDGPPFDAILIDTDNGPDAMCIDSNAALYDDAGIELMKAVLAPNGTLAVWSAHPDPAFTRRLRRAGLTVRERSVRGHRGRGARHTIFLAFR
jgi:spermidine synthase